LGATQHAGRTEEGRKLVEALSGDMPDNKKFLYITSNFGSSPEEAIAPIRAFGNSIKEDPMTKEAVLLFCEDELSSARWLANTCAMLNPASAGTSASASM
jgi:hypothetical protein